MTVLIGTADGVYRAPGVPFDDAERVLDCGAVAQVRAFDAVDGAFAATRAGLYRSTDGGESWDRLDLPHDAAWSVLATDDRTLYAGTAPAHLYRSDDGGRTWGEVTSLQDQPSRAAWTSPVDDDARLRTLGAHPGAPGLLIAGVESGRLHVSDDGGATWAEHGDPIPDDVHHVLVRGPGEFVVSTGYLGLDGRAPGGLYRTTDAGASWTRLDAAVDRSYFREAVEAGGRLFAAAARGSPGTWADGDADAALYESDDDGETLESVPYPGGPEEVVIAWAVSGGTVLAGTAAGPAGSVLRRGDDGEWRRGGRVPGDVHSLASP